MRQVEEKRSMNAMSASTGSTASIPTGRSVPPPAVEVNSGWHSDSAAVLCSFNGVQHRAVVDVGDGNVVRPGDIAAALRVLAASVEAA